MKKTVFLLICFALAVFVSCCVTEVEKHSGVVTHKEYQEPVWGVGIGPIGRGNTGAVPELFPEQYLITVRILDRDWDIPYVEDVFSVGLSTYESIDVGDIVACECVGDFFTCNFEED